MFDGDKRSLEPEEQLCLRKLGEPPGSLGFLCDQGGERQELVFQPYKASQGQEAIHFWGESTALQSGFWRLTLTSSALDPPEPPRP